MKFNRCMDMSAYPEAVSPEYSSDKNMDMSMMSGMGCPGNVMMCQPIYECPQVRCCHRVINYEVPQV